MKYLYDEIATSTSRMVTHHYSTSFSMGIRFFAPYLRNPIYAVYGFVRQADEIVDSFHGYDKRVLLKRFREDTRSAIRERISLNPILHAFQEVVHCYGIEEWMIETFLDSMEMDLDRSTHDRETYQTYILGSAEVVGLMCLKIFTGEQPGLYPSLKDPARALGSGFQKVNFLRDLHEDREQLGRTYFPGIDMNSFSDEEKRAIEQEIVADLQKAHQGIRKLPESSKKGVYMAYVYYLALLRKIQATDARAIMRERVRIPDLKKMWLSGKILVRFQLDLL